MIVETLPAIAALSLEQKWSLAVELWDEVDERQAELPANPAILKIVEERFADFERDPSTAMTLEQFKRRFQLP